MTFLLVFCAFTAAQAQNIHKGLPNDLDKAELIIVRYETKDLVPEEAKSYESIYASPAELQQACTKANTELSNAAKYAYPFTYQLLSANQVKNLSGKNYYIFEPAKIYGAGGPWGSVPLYLRNL